MSAAAVRTAPGRAARTASRGDAATRSALGAPGLDSALAVGVTVLGAAIAWVLGGGPPLIGIDDAAITRAYAENIAAGHGFVYNIGGERVEGATSTLWTLVVALVYSAAARPEPVIVALALAATAWAVWSALALTRLVAAGPGAAPERAVAVVALLLVASPGYFFWAGWSMMETAVWSAALLWLCLRCARLAETGAGRDGWLPLAAALPPLIRPEGVAAAVGLLALAALLAPRGRRAVLAAAGTALAVFAALTLARLAYFGQPLPNTFYAKVSSDRLADLMDGAKYLASFVLGAPFAGLFLACWGGLGLWAAAAATMRGPRPGAAAALIGASALFGVLATYAALGGDHFALWRFYQPVAPLLPIAAAALVGAAWEIWRERGPSFAVRAGVAALCAAAIVGSGWAHLRQSRFDLLKEFALVEQGLAFGAMLNGVRPRPTLGVVPAGGIALAYDGEILDLMGLNWREMARANRVKTGPRNHASFDMGVFWSRSPELFGRFNKPCTEGPWVENDAHGGVLDGLLASARFQAEYAPVRIHGEAACWTGFARRDWLARSGDARFAPVEWTELTLR